MRVSPTQEYKYLHTSIITDKTVPTSFGFYIAFAVDKMDGCGLKNKWLPAKENKGDALY